MNASGFTVQAAGRGALRVTRVCVAAGQLTWINIGADALVQSAKNMLIRTRKLVLYLLLACLPLQSVAGSVHLLPCDDATPAVADGSRVH